MVTQPVPVAEVVLWGRRIAAVAWDDQRQVADFEYDRDFLASGIQVAPITMPLRSGVFRFPELAFRTFKGLPGMIADSLPDRFGTLVLDAWLRRLGRSRETLTPVEQLLYAGARGMGALEYRPPIERNERAVEIDVDTLADVAAAVLADRGEMRADLAGISDLFRVGTSAGGARAKALVAWNPDTNEVRSGQVPAPEDFQSWLLKFDGVNSRDHDLSDPQGFGLIEFAYHLMATAAGLVMMECRLMPDSSGRNHFMTRRFDRSSDGSKLHTQTLAAMAHYDFNQPGRYGYEDAFEVARRIQLPVGDLEQLYRRMVFNLVARNQDDHTKNISFAMNKTGEWRLAPAYDVIWAYSPFGDWTARHQMTVNGKRVGFTRTDLRTVAKEAGVSRPDEILAETVDVVAAWPEFARQVGVDPNVMSDIGGSHRLSWEE